MGRVRELFFLCFLMLAAACSMEAAIEKMSSPEDRAFAMRFVDNVRSGDIKALELEFAPELWAKSREQLATARSLFPPGEGTTRLVSYRFSTNVANGATSTRKEYILVTTDRTHWARTRILTLAEGGTAKVVEWKVDASHEPPPELAMIEAWDSALPWLRAGLAIGIAAMGGLIFWLVRRSRRAHGGR